MLKQEIPITVNGALHLYKCKIAEGVDHQKMIDIMRKVKANRVGVPTIAMLRKFIKQVQKLEGTKTVNLPYFDFGELALTNNLLYNDSYKLQRLQTTSTRKLNNGRNNYYNNR